MSKNHWTAYWKSGVLTSLPADFKVNYDGELADYWLSVLQQYDQEITTLDVCTGNGAVAILVKQLAQQLDLNINMTAVDASDIKPASILNNFPDMQDVINQIDFIGNCLIENMCEKINSKFELIVSQYGIEYCETEPAAQNIVKLLKEKGKFVFISHAPETAMMAYMQTEEQVYQVLEDVKAFEILHQFSNDKTTVNGFKIKLKACLAAMSLHAAYRSNALFNTWGNTLSQLLNMPNAALKQQRIKAKEFSQQYEFARARANDMLRVSDKLLNDPKWYQAFERAGLTLINQGDIRYQNTHNVGHFYEFTKD
ncbi:class I SAM-dependent methyltransferase [Marinicella litoralis]|uniref:Methyltransferase family protein n=1 Tax=Marinicella litoralis TaxID=644220 RepID=A0A4R6XXC8_9GAMM|nr:hypothetical protein [Marinicella litoralis]TDR23249.1 hypothetical protein C8D91_0109 [Marinicella litoralis]